MLQRRFRQIDVFTNVPYAGNPLAVVLDAKGLTTDEMQRFAQWTNLSETTFLLPPTEPEADYRVRIFTSASSTPHRSAAASELPFAGHPTLGTCHAWLTASGTPKREDVVIQECGAGLVPIRRTPAGLAFAAPPLIRSGPRRGVARRAHRVRARHRPRRDRRRRLGRQRAGLGRRPAR